MAINRRDLLKLIASAGVAPSLVSCNSNTDFTDDNDLPNVVLITADDLGWKDLSCYGNPNIKTKNLDLLAEQGAYFSNAFGATSSCSSARATFITGQYPHTHGVDGLAHIHLRKYLPFDKKPLAEVLSDKGFETAIWGKWHVAPFFPTSWYGYQKRFSPPLITSEPDPETIAQFIQKASKHRFYLELNYMENHRDTSGSFQYADGFPVDPNKIDVMDYLNLPNNIPELKEELAQFYSQTLQMDHDIGLILKELKAQNLENNTLVIFVSDNGSPFPGNKITLYDRGIGTPLLVKWPKQIAKANIQNSLVSTVDIYPTILDACKISVPKETQGQSLLPLIAGNAPEREAIFSEMTYHVNYIPSRSVRTQGWKYIRNYSSDAFGLDQLSKDAWAQKLCELPNQPWLKPRVKEELYDLKNDPHEQINLANTHTENKSHLVSLLEKHQKLTDDPYGKEQYQPFS